jgi:hypothetical protein
MSRPTPCQWMHLPVRLSAKSVSARRTFFASSLSLWGIGEAEVMS